MIHSKAVVATGADLGCDVSVGAFSLVEDGVRVGDGCRIGSHVAILRGTELGAGCEVHAGAVLGGCAQDKTAETGASQVRIGAGCIVREGVTVHRGSKAGSCTDIGEGCFLMAFSHCAHNVRLGRSVILANGALLAGYVCVGDGVFISGHCMVHQFVRIGRLAMMGGGSGLSKDLPPFCLTEPLRVNSVAGLNVVGMRRAGLDAAARANVKRAFDRIYRSGLSVGEAVASLRAGPEGGGPASELCDFIERSERGICVMDRPAAGPRRRS